MVALCFDGKKTWRWHLRWRKSVLVILLYFSSRFFERNGAGFVRAARLRRNYSVCGKFFEVVTSSAHRPAGRDVAF